MAAGGSNGGKMDALRKNLDDLTKCNVCLDKCVNPKILKCHHTFCGSCIDGIIDKCQYNFFQCPLCRCRCDCRDTFPPSIYIQELLDILNKDNVESKDGELYMCKMCTGNQEATQVCIDCDVNVNHLCDGCNNFHQKLLKTHTVTSLSDFKNSSISAAMEMKKKIKKCQEHGQCGSNVEIFCYTCSKQICLKCAVTEHDGHKKENISKIAESVNNMMNKIEMDIKPLIQHSEEEISGLDSKIAKIGDVTSLRENEIKEYVGSLHKMLDEKEEILIGKLRQKTSTQCATISEVKEEAETIFARKESFLHYMHSLKKFGNDSHLVDEKGNIEGRWEQIQELRMSTQVEDKHADIIFEKDEKLEHEIKTLTLGQINACEIIHVKGLEHPSSEISLDSLDTESERTSAELPGQDNDPYASSSDDVMPPRKLRLSEGLSIIATVKSGIKVSGFTITDENEFIIVSHASRKCLVYQSLTDKPTEITDKLVRPWDAAVGNREIDDRKRPPVLPGRDGIRVIIGVIYVTDTGDGSVKIYTKDGAFVSVLTSGLKKPHGIAVAENGDVYVCDAEERNVIIVPPGQAPTIKLKQFGGNPLFQCPWYITITKAGDKIVSDFEAKCLRIVKGNGSVVNYGVETRLDLKEFQPAKSCVHPKNGCVFVVDHVGNTIHILNQEGKLLKVLRSDEIPVRRPIGLGFDTDARLWIVSHHGVVNQINVDFQKLIRYTNVELGSPDSA